VGSNQHNRAGAKARLRALGVGDERRLGLWLLPLFLLTAALAATLAGGLAVLYYSQQVSSLRTETAGARAQLDEAVATVEAAVEDATTTIDEQVARVRAQLAQDPPVDSPNDAGVYAVAAAHADGEVRVGSAFTVFSDENETFLVTTYGLVARRGGGAVERVEVYLPGQTVTGAVHGFDRSLDLATVLLRGGPLPVPEWRPAEEPVELGDVLYLVGVGGPDAPAVIEGRVAAASAETVVTTIAVNSFTAGGPLLDADARVVAIAALGFAPFGPAEGPLHYAVPVRSLCRGLLRCTASDLGAAGGGEGGAVQEGAGGRAPGARATAPSPRPSPSPTPLPSPSPSPSPDGPTPPPPAPVTPTPPPDPQAEPTPPPEQEGG
jgi:S1-C subfamily serine protease